MTGIAQSLAAFTFAALAALVAGFHLLLVLGAPWGHLTMGGRWPGRLPGRGRAVSALSLCLLLAMAWAVLAQAGLVPGGAPPRWALPAIAGYLVLGVLAHIVTPSAAERRLWLPVLVAMLAALGLAMTASG